MLVIKGKVTRNISASQLPEYKANGYSEVKTPEEPKTAKKGK